MQIEFLFGGAVQRQQAGHFLNVGPQRVGMLFVRHPQARRYLLRVCEGTVRVTIPRGGSLAYAKEFAARNVPWIEKQLLKRPACAPGRKAWVQGTEILFRGELVLLREEVSEGNRAVCFGSERIRMKGPVADFRPLVERHLWRMAARELPGRVLELARSAALEVRRVTVRNQRSRWGSCSRRRTISLNWRLVQTSNFVRDYIILHELAHLKEMNHSKRFWAEVARLCPDFEVAESWLKRHSGLLR